MSLFTPAFWRLAAERALKTAAQAALLILGADQLNALRAEWSDVGGFALGGAVLSLLTSIVSSPIGPKGSPSMVAAPPLTPADGDRGAGDTGLLWTVLAVLLIIAVVVWLAGRL